MATYRDKAFGLVISQGFGGILETETEDHVVLSKPLYKSLAKRLSVQAYVATIVLVSLVATGLGFYLGRFLH